MRFRYIIGIDADLHLSGIAMWDNQERKWLHVGLMELEDIVYHFLPGKPREITKIYLEAGYMNKQANFRRGHKSSVSESIAMRVGMNHATSMLLSRMLKKAGWIVDDIAPLGKGNGLLKKDGRWTAVGKKYVAEQSGISRKLKDEELDAVYIAMAFRIK